MSHIVCGFPYLFSRYFILGCIMGSKSFRLSDRYARILKSAQSGKVFITNAMQNQKLYHISNHNNAFVCRDNRIFVHIMSHH